MEKECIAAKIFIEAVLPSLLRILDYYPIIAEKFNNKSFVFQILVDDEDCSLVICFEANCGVWTYKIGQVNENPDIEFAFDSVYNFNSFLMGVSTPYPKIKGILKIGLFKNVLALIAKFGFIMQAISPHENAIDNACQTRILFEVLPKAISVLSAENLAEIVGNFSGGANITLIIEVADINYAINDMVLKYAPRNSAQLPSEQVYSFTFPNENEVAGALLTGEFSKEIIIVNSSQSCDIMRLFVKSVNYYVRLKFRS